MFRYNLGKAAIYMFRSNLGKAAIYMFRYHLGKATEAREAERRVHAPPALCILPEAAKAGGHTAVSVGVEGGV